MKTKLIILAVLCAASLAQAKPLTDQTEKHSIIVDRLDPHPCRFRFFWWFCFLR